MNSENNDSGRALKRAKTEYSSRSPSPTVAPNPAIPAPDHLQLPISASAAAAEKRVVCDHCRRRRVKCDGLSPCENCTDSSLSCTRDHVPRKRGPKRGHGRVINQLRASEASSGSATPFSGLSDASAGTEGAGTAMPQGDVDLKTDFSSSSHMGLMQAHGPPSADGQLGGTQSAFTTNAYRPNSRSYLHLVPRCVELYYDHIYPIMPLLYMPHVRGVVSRPGGADAMTPHEKNLVFALCALTSFHMSGKSLSPINGGHPPDAETEERGRKVEAVDIGPDATWETVGRFFLDECIAVRNFSGGANDDETYDFLEDNTLWAVISSFWLSTSFFEINQDRKSWYYLREALTLALELGLDNEAKYPSSLGALSLDYGYGNSDHGGSQVEQQGEGNIPTNQPYHDNLEPSPEAIESLCRRRVFWILFVTERSYAVLRNKALTFRRTPSLPTRGHNYEAPDIHAGFMGLVQSYVPLDESFVNAWNDGKDPRVSATTYLNLQRVLSRPPDFIRGHPSGVTGGNNGEQLGGDSHHRYISNLYSPGGQNTNGNLNTHGHAHSHSNTDPQIYHTKPEPTDIQKADLLMTQQWLRLIVWQSSFRQGLLSLAASDESGMSFSFPLQVARDAVRILQSLPSHAIEVHGMGMFEKIFEIGTWYVNVLEAYEKPPQPPQPSRRPPPRSPRRRNTAPAGYFGGGGGASAPQQHNVVVPPPSYSTTTTPPIPQSTTSSPGAPPMSSSAATAFRSGMAPAGMDFIGNSSRGGGDLGLLGGRNGGRFVGATTDPLEFFVKMLSASPNSRTMFADKLLMFASESSAAWARTALSPALHLPPQHQQHQHHHSSSEAGGDGSSRSSSSSRGSNNIAALAVRQQVYGSRIAENNNSMRGAMAMTMMNSSMDRGGGASATIDEEDSNEDHQRRRRESQVFNFGGVGGAGGVSAGHFGGDVSSQFI